MNHPAVMFLSSLQVASELLIRVPSTTPSIPPTLPTPSPLLPTDTLYIASGDLLTHNLTIHDADSILGVRLRSVLPLPEGAWLGDLQFTGAYTGTSRRPWILRPTSQRTPRQEKTVYKFMDLANYCV